MSDETALGRAHAACCAIRAILNRLEEDPRLFALLDLHALSARANLEATTVSDAALDEFDRTMKMFRAQSKTPPQP